MSTQEKELNEEIVNEEVKETVENNNACDENEQAQEPQAEPTPEERIAELEAQLANEKKEYLGTIAAADVLKADSEAAVKAMQALKLDVVMLTGDNEKTAKAIAAKAGITHVIADVLPTDKANAVEKLRSEGRKVLMVGDGINDAPALVTADVGMAIGAGTDIAMESADVVLMNSSLRGVSSAIELSKATIRNIRQNLFWAFFYNTLGIPLAAGLLYLPFGLQLSPMIGAAAMSMSSVFVVTNALRLRFFKAKTEALPCSCPAAEPEAAPREDEPPAETLILQVNGMMCGHCTAAVEKACMSVPGTVSAEASLEEKCVRVTGTADYEMLKQIWTSQNLTLIKSIDDRTMEAIHYTLSRNVIRTVDRKEIVSELTQTIKHMAGVNEKRAALIACDQVGKLNSQLAQYEQVQLELIQNPLISIFTP